MARSEIVYADAIFRLGVARNLLVAVWYDAPRVEHLRGVLKAAVAPPGKRRVTMALLNIIVSGTPRFTDEVRGELVRAMGDPRTQVEGNAHSVEVGGLAGTATRAFLSTALLLSRTDKLHKVFSDRRAAAAWLVPILSGGGEVWSTADVLEAAADVVARAAPRVA